MRYQRWELPLLLGLLVSALPMALSKVGPAISKTLIEKLAKRTMARGAQAPCPAMGLNIFSLSLILLS